MTIDYGEIRAKQQAATPGPWKWVRNGFSDDPPELHIDHGWQHQGPDLVRDDGVWEVCGYYCSWADGSDSDRGTQRQPGHEHLAAPNIISSWGYDADGVIVNRADAEYIAAVSPDVVGALLDRIAELRAALESAQRFLTIPGSGFKDYLLAEIETALAANPTHDCSCVCHGKHEESGHSLCSHCDAGYAAYEATHEQVIGGQE